MPQTLYLSATDAQANLTKAFNHVEKGGKVVFTKYGKKLGTLIPEKPKRTNRSQYKFSARQLAQFEKWMITEGDPNKTVNSTAEIRKMRDEE